MTWSRVSRTLAVVAVMTLLAAGLPNRLTTTSYAATTGQAAGQFIPPDMGSWQMAVSTSSPDTSHPSAALPATPVHNGQHTDTFTDIANHWAKSDIEALHSMGIIGGNGTGRFEPDRAITKAELVKILVTVAKIPAAPATASKGVSPDIAKLDPKAWYYPYVMSAVSAGIISPTDGKFEPGGAATREQFAAWAIRAIGKGSLAASAVSAATSFADYQQISTWARGYVGLAKELGIVQGFGGRVMPQGQVTRAEAAAMTMRVINLDLTPPTVRVSGRTATSVTLSYSEPVNVATAQNVGNYEVSGLRVTAAKIQIDGKTVVLTTGTQATGQTYSIKVKNVRDLAWNVIPTASLSLGTKAGPVPGRVVYQDPRHVEVQFDQEIAPEATVQIKVVDRATGQVFGNPYMLEAEGKTLKVMVSADLVPGASYSIALAGVRSIAGLVMNPAVLNFTVSQ